MIKQISASHNIQPKRIQQSHEALDRVLQSRPGFHDSLWKRINIGISVRRWAVNFNKNTLIFVL